jgi:hypothetical protein
MGHPKIPVDSIGGTVPYPIGSMYGIYANIGGILMVNVTIYSIHGSYGYKAIFCGDIHLHRP